MANVYKISGGVLIEGEPDTVKQLAENSLKLKGSDGTATIELSNGDMISVGAIMSMHDGKRFCYQRHFIELCDINTEDEDCEDDYDYDIDEDEDEDED